jgi:hypothetical protein
MDQHSFLKLDHDPDLHSPKKLYPCPDPHTVNADQKHCFAVVDTFFPVPVFSYRVNTVGLVDF